MLRVDVGLPSSSSSSFQTRSLVSRRRRQQPPQEQLKVALLLIMVWSSSSNFIFTSSRWQGVVQAFHASRSSSNRPSFWSRSRCLLPKRSSEFTTRSHRLHSTFLSAFTNMGIVGTTKVSGFTQSRCPCRRNSFAVLQLSSLSSKAANTMSGDDSESSSLQQESSNTTTTTITNTSSNRTSTAARSSSSMFPDKDMTGTSVTEILESSITWLESFQIPECEESTIQLLAEALGLPWSNGYRMLRECRGSHSTLGKRQLSHKEWTTYQKMLIRRQHQEPIQYILGKWDFLDFTLAIQAPLLCPRPETEELVHVVAKNVLKDEGGVVPDNHNNKKIRMLDIGCGTGAIGIGLATLVGPQAQVVAIDVEPLAVETSMTNAIAILGHEEVMIKQQYQALLCSAKDFTISSLSSSSLLAQEDDTNDTHTTQLLFDVVVSNPPYIPRSDMDTLTDDVVQYESDKALCGGLDGMDVIRDIVHKLPSICKMGGYCWMEVDPTHPSLLKEWLDRDFTTLGVSYVQGYQDMFGKDRFVQLQVL